MKLAITALALGLAGAAHGEMLKIGSKRFTESYILGEVLKRQIELSLIHISEPTRH